MKIIIYAPNIHTGGGAVLLKEIVKSSPHNMRILFILNEQLESDDIFDEVNAVYFSGSLIGRIQAECYLKSLSVSYNHIVCLHNIPPIFNYKGRTSVLLQNRLIIDKSARHKFGFKSKFKLCIESLLVRMGARRNVSYIVQTESMKQALQTLVTPYDVNINILPFAKLERCGITNALELNSSYIYIASAEPHKNHVNLFLAWEILAKVYGKTPQLLLTLPNGFAELEERVKQNGLNIINLGSLEHSKVLEYLKSCKALIYPSKTESFGLPLVEAMSFNVPIIASELDYVRDVCEPIETFDPDSALSIARAIARFEGFETAPRNICEASSFWDTIL